MSLLGELKRRNVFRVAIAYAAVAWLTLQVADVVLGNLPTPDWLFPILMLLVAIGFPFAIVFAWAFELTPQGLKRDKEVDRSHPVARDTGRKLNGVIVAVLALAVAFLLVDRFLMQSPSREGTDMEKSVAVLPFVAMSEGPNDEYFADGLTEEILNALTRVPDLLVTARTSAFHFKNSDVPIPEIAEILGVAYVVEGSVRRDGDRLRVTAQLIRADNGFHLWSENYDRRVLDALDVQRDIAEKIAGALNVVLDDELRERMHASGLQSPEAFIAFQKAYEQFQKAHNSGDMAEGLVLANEYFDRVLDIAPGYSKAHLLHADLYAHKLLDETLSSPRTESERLDIFDHLNGDLENAIETAPDEASRLAATYDLLITSGNWQNAQSVFDQILAIRPCNLPQWFDVPNIAYGRADDVLSLSKRLMECNPINYHGWVSTVWSQVWLGNVEAALSIARKGLELNMHDLKAASLISALLASNQFDEARLVSDTLIRDPERKQRTDVSIDLAQGFRVTPENDFRDLSAAYGDKPHSLIIFHARAGRDQEANRIASEVDGWSSGHLILLLAVSTCRCGAPWDINTTPNFERKLRQADMGWPPSSPIVWPLKDG